VSVIDCIDERSHYLHLSFVLEEFSGEIVNNEPELCFEWKFFFLDSLPEPLFKPHQKIIKNYLENVLYLERK